MFGFVGLTALAIVVFMGKSYENSLQALDSTTHAMLALETTSDGIKPVLPMKNFVTNKRLNPTFNDHPFTLFYLSGKAMRFFGVDGWSARLVATLFSVGCVLAVAILGAMMYSPAVGLVAGLILTASRDFVLIGSRFHLDTAMIFFIILSFIAWWKRRTVCTGVAAGLGLWMKTPVAFLIFPSALLALIFSKKLTRAEFKNLLLSGLIALAVGSGVWILTGLLGGWDLVADYWTRQVWGTAVGGRGGGNYGFWWGLYLLNRNYLPWVYLLIVSLAAILLRKRWLRPEVALPLAAALIVELVISSMRFKFYWYFLPIFPFLALLCTDVLSGWLKKHQQGVTNFFIGAGMLVPAMLVATPIDFGPETFPALRKFEAIIQSYGTTSDRVMFVDGHQPYGSDLDSIYELSFYTSRRILQSNCLDANTWIKSDQPEWIVVTAPNHQNCLSPELLKPYATQFKFGRQYLFSRIIQKSPAIDLTPLARELKPVQEGKMAPLPNHPFFPSE